MGVGITATFVKLVAVDDYNSHALVTPMYMRSDQGGVIFVAPSKQSTDKVYCAYYETYGCEDYEIERDTPVFSITANGDDVIAAIIRLSVPVGIPTSKNGRAKPVAVKYIEETPHTTSTGYASLSEFASRSAYAYVMQLNSSSEIRSGISGTYKARTPMSVSADAVKTSSGVMKYTRHKSFDVEVNTILGGVKRTWSVSENINNGLTAVAIHTTPRARTIRAFSRCMARVGAANMENAGDVLAEVQADTGILGLRGSNGVTRSLLAMNIDDSEDMDLLERQARLLERAASMYRMASVLVQNGVSLPEASEIVRSRIEFETDQSKEHGK